MIDRNRKPITRQSRYEAFAIAVGVAVLGILIGSFAAILGGNYSQADAAKANPSRLDLANAPAVVSFSGARPTISQAYYDAPERLSPWGRESGAPRPKIAIVFDDMGLDRTVFEKTFGFPGPVTFSFLPYGKGLQSMADKARHRGDGVLLHLPMEPQGTADPGPHALKTGIPGIKLLDELDWNLSRFSGYSGVNNHMGSQFTKSEAHMKTVLSVLKDRGLFFLDSVTTGQSAASSAAASTGTEALYRDIFLDADAGPDNIKAQLRRAEAIAIQTGFVVAICHPRKETLQVVGPWLTSAPARGFDLVTIDEIRRLTTASAKIAQNSAD